MRQHVAPVFLPPQGEAARLSTDHGERTFAVRGYDEAFVQSLVMRHPDLLPVREIDPSCDLPVPVCSELSTAAGPIDGFLLTPSGRPVLVECKLWTNPQARREVVGQILDYAKELRRWTYDDLQRAASARIHDGPKSLFQRVAGGAQGDPAEADFIDAVSHNLRTGRFLLVIVGDGIREGVEAIGEYLNDSVGLDFSFGLVEMPVFTLPEGRGAVVTPRLLARTAVLGRYVVTLPEQGGLKVEEERNQRATSSAHSAPNETAEENLTFWAGFLDGFDLDDPGQSKPNPSKGPVVYFPLPVQTPDGPSRGVWITVYLARAQNLAGVFLGGSADGIGAEITQALAREGQALLDALGDRAWISDQRSDGRIHIGENFPLPNLSDPEGLADLIATLRERTNHYINVLRPRVDAAARRID